MRINFLTSELSGLTGGVIYDEIFYRKLVERFGENSVNLILDDSFGDKHLDETINYKRFGLLYKENAEVILDCNYLILNSRLYTRFTKFPWDKLRKSKCKLITIHHHFNYMTESGFRALVHRYYELKFLKYVDVIITPNLYVMDELKKRKLSGKACLIQSYMDNKVKEIKCRKENKILFIGTVIPRKGIEYSIKAFAEFHRSHPEYSLEIAGRYDKNSIFFKKLLKLLELLKLRQCVHFRGRVDAEEKGRLLMESKVFLFPSLNEGYGLVMIEAMSYGLPVIAFNNTAMPYTVNDTNGRLVKNKSVKELARALNCIIDDTALYKKLSRGAVEKAKSLPSIEDLDAEYDHFMNRLGEGI